MRDNLLGQLRDLNKSKPRGKADESLIGEITRLESACTVAKDDLVRYSISRFQNCRRELIART